MVEHRAGAAVLEVEIGVMSEVAERRLVCRRLVFDRQRAGDLQAVGAGDVEGAGKPHVPIGRVEAEGDEVAAVQCHLPQPVAEAQPAAMQRVLAEEIGVELNAAAGQRD